MKRVLIVIACVLLAVAYMIILTEIVGAVAMSISMAVCWIMFSVAVIVLTPKQDEP
jgi:hypothetical protein